MSRSRDILLLILRYNTETRKHSSSPQNTKTQKHENTKTRKHKNKKTIN
ncbi:MAG: hypothetical protein V1825_03635 [Candidatus Falkowbacteria bacterium]